MPSSGALPSSRLEALANAGFVPTPLCVQERLRHLVALPTQGRYSVLDLTCGRGDFLVPFDGPLADLYGVEIHGPRAAAARTRLPRATIIHAPYEETAISRGRVSLGLANFPYFYQDGERLEHLGLVDLTRLLQVGGVLLTLLPARSAFNRTRAPVIINHLVKHYTNIRIWRVPDEVFSLYTQIVIGAVKRERSLKTIDEAPEEKQWLERWIYRTSDVPGESPWGGGAPPPELPTEPLSSPYAVPVATQPLQLRVFRPDRALLLQYLAETGVHTTAAWQRATSWSPGVALEQPLVAIEGEAHIAACAMLDMFACEAFLAPDGSRLTLLAHLEKEWVPVEPDLEERKEGVVAIEQEQDKLQLSALDMTRGKLSHYQGDEVYAFLDPLLPTMKQRIQERYPPLYQGQPERWLVEATATIGMDRTLRGSSMPGLVRKQLETVWAMWAALSAKGRVGLAGEQGVGKTRLTIALMAAFAYAWRHAEEVFGTHRPRWMVKLERAWSAHPRLPGSRPQALPCLIVCPLNVVESVWMAEIQAAWPEAECLVIDDYQDIPTWFARCATSSAPAVIALLSQSKTRATRRCWLPAVISHEQSVTRLDLSDAVLEAGGVPEFDEHGTLLWYRDPETDEPISTVSKTMRFSCPRCGKLIVGHPMGTKKGERTAALQDDEDNAPSPDAQVEASAQEAILSSQSASTRLEHDRLTPVGSMTYFAFKPRTCSCGSPLWTAARITSVERKYPRLSFAEWIRAVEALLHTQTNEKGIGAEQALYNEGPDLTTCKSKEGRPLARLAELPPIHTGPVCISVPDLSIDRTRLWMERGICIGYQLPDGALVTTLYDWRTRQRSGYVSQATGKMLMKHYGFVAPPEDSFSPFTYLKHFYRGLVAFTQIDESHNARNRDTDVGESIQEAQAASQIYAHATGTPYGGLLKSFYYEQARLHAGFWKRLGFGWQDVGAAQAEYGFSRVMTYEHEERAHRGSGRTVTTDVRRSAPGMAVSLLPHLFSEWMDLSLDMLGAHLPERIETPLLISMTDPLLEEKRTQMHERWREVYWQERAAKDAYDAAVQAAGPSEGDAAVIDAQTHWQQSKEQLRQVQEVQRQEEAWMTARDLHTAYRRASEDLRELAATHDAAKLAQDWLLRLWTTLPFWDDPRYAISTTTRGDWGDVEGQELLYQMPHLAEDYLYPLERLCYEVVGREVAAERPIAIAFLQNGKRNTAARLQQVLRDFHPWTLTNDIEPNEREQAVKNAVAAGYKVLLMPFQRTREGYNFQKEIPSGYWYEMPDRLFDLEQWQRRFWRLGQEREVHLYFPAMIGTAAFNMLYRLGMMSAGLSLFLGKTPTSGLARLVGAHKTALARLSAALASHTDNTLFTSDHAEDEEAAQHLLREQIVSAFEQRNAEYRALSAASHIERDDEVQRWIWTARRRALGLPCEPIPVCEATVNGHEEPAHAAVRVCATDTSGEHPWEAWRRREQALRQEQRRQRIEATREKARLRRALLREGKQDASPGAETQRHVCTAAAPPLVVQATLWCVSNENNR